MGRIFEVRKHAMFARWNRMAKQFARIGKDITIAVRQGGPEPANNPALRRVIQNARAINMPKDKVEAAIRRASGQEAVDYQEVLYEGYAPHGIAVLVETATDNPVRTVASDVIHTTFGCRRRASISRRTRRTAGSGNAGCSRPRASRRTRAECSAISAIHCFPVHRSERLP